MAVTSMTAYATSPNGNHRRQALEAYCLAHIAVRRCWPRRHDPLYRGHIRRDLGMIRDWRSVMYPSTTERTTT